MAPRPAAEDDDFLVSSDEESALLAAVGDASASSAKRARPEDDHSLQPAAKRPTGVHYPATSPLAVKILNDRFGLPAFRLEQEAVIARLLAGGSAVVVFPTGGGKSLCYQVPALAFPELDAREPSGRGPQDAGVTIVVSPLIALMKDQVDALQRRNISAACMDSTKSRDEYLGVVDRLRQGSIRLLYCAPERLNNEGFVQTIRTVRGGVRLVAVDEAHCISEWGHSFRPDYLKVARFVSEIKAERVVCLTATATPKVAKDICDAFGVDESGLFRTPMHRPNLRLLAQSARDKQDMYPRVFSFLREHPGPSIVYVTLQKQAEALAADLRAQGFHARHFHAGMQTHDKTALQDEFMQRDDMVICATIAFGMGIDKPNIRNIVHFDIPRSVEGYSQQIGRAGRDGLASTCMLCLTPDDFYLQENLTYGDLPSKESVRRFLQEVCSREHARLDVGETFTVSHYKQSRDYDIRINTLGILYSKLELQLGLIRATAPQYSSYSYTVVNANQLEHDKSRAAMVLKKSASKAAKYTHVDVDSASRAGGLLRADLVRKLNEWNDNDFIELKSSGVEHVYRVLRKLPSTPSAIEDILEPLYVQMQERERLDLIRTQAIVNLATEKACFSYRIAEYFGDKSQDLHEGCGHCTWCETKKQVVLPERSPVPTNHAQIQEVLRACPVRDDARFLARVAFGISSPRVTEMKLSRHPVFGSLNDHDFLALIRIFDAACRNDPSSSKTDTEDRKAAKPRDVARAKGAAALSRTPYSASAGRGGGTLYGRFGRRANG